MCREDAQELSSRYAPGGTNIGSANLYGIIKEVAPVKGAATDEKLGVGEFQQKYFGNNPVYIDPEQKFYEFMGKKSLLSQPWFSWNPFALYSGYQRMAARLKSKRLDGNMAGEGLLQGGLLIIHPTKGVVYRHNEETGTPMPYDEIDRVVQALLQEGNLDVSDGSDSQAAATSTVAQRK